MTRTEPSGADVAKAHTARRVARTQFAIADRAYDVALTAFENAVIAKDAARKQLAAAETTYTNAKTEAGQ